MSLACTKDLSITIAESTPKCFAYFKCDEANGAAELVNSVDAFNIPWSGGPTRSAAGKIGTSVIVGALPGSFVSDNIAHWVLPGSFTLRFWYKPSLDSQTAGLISSSQWDIWKMWDGANIYLEAEVHTSGGWPLVDSVALVPNAWNYIVFYFESGNEIGISVNAGAFAGLSIPGQTIVTPATTTFGWGLVDTAGPDYIDEVALWTRKLTAAEITTDYNAGAGKTYPDIPGP